MNYHKCFIGTEAEGPYRGKKTLFIPGCVSESEFEAAYQKCEKEVEALYIGAGGYRSINPITLSAVMTLHKDKHILLTIETQARSGEVMVMVFPGNANPERSFEVYRKYELEHFILWVNTLTSEQYLTLAYDALFGEDKVVE